MDERWKIVATRGTIPGGMIHGSSSYLTLDFNPGRSRNAIPHSSSLIGYKEILTLFNQVKIFQTQSFGLVELDHDVDTTWLWSLPILRKP